MSPSSIPLGWSNKAADLKSGATFSNASKSFLLPNPYKPLLIHNNSMDYLVQCGDQQSDLCLVIWNDISGDVMRIEFPTKLEDVWSALPFSGTVEAEEKGPKWPRVAEESLNHGVEIPADPTDWRAEITYVE